MNKAKDYLVEGGFEYARTVLSKAVGNQRASEILEKITDATQVNRPFAIARKADASQLLNVINYEHPQTIALILCLAFIFIILFKIKKNKGILKI
jgi:flagellar motor switch protein FliG